MVKNIVLFNTTEYTDYMDNTYYLNEMLKNISNEGEPETLAVWSCNKAYSKFRPFIYDLSEDSEKEAVDVLLKEA